ncbi:hypothetical protein TRIUR3_03393 [Triticum urartu]|uniref:Uncharacterized protein n=1 Tax=Triticum urartu TaxID=4572 RepID=M7ZCZ9_TRIUA|nr:hypothetical protein TRIUR3_03393 [Triticum urartu]
MASSSTAKPMEALPSGSGSILSNVVTVLLLLSLGFVFGMVYNANFQESYLTPFLQPLPSLLRPSPTPVNTSWGNMNLVDAERRLLGTALLDLGNARFALLSETCIPLLSFPAAYAFLIGANASFIDSFPTRARHAPFFLRRNISRAQWRKGSQWFEMDRELAIDVVAEERYMAVFRGDHGIANMLEHYMPTLVTLLGWGVRAANRTLTYTDWPRPGPHPASYDVRDVTPELLGGMRRGNGECGYGAGGAGGGALLVAGGFLRGRARQAA